MKITDNMKSVYTGLGTVRGYMPSADTVKNWAIEPIKSTWSKPAGKAIFIAAGAMATLAIGIKLISLMKNKSEKPSLEQSNLHEQYQKLMSKYTFEELNHSRKNYENSSAELSPDQQIMLSAIKDVAEVKRKVEVSSMSSIFYSDVMDCITYTLGNIKTIPAVLRDQVREREIARHPTSTLKTNVEEFKKLKSGFENSFGHAKTLIQNEMNELQKIIKGKYQALSQVA